MKKIFIFFLLATFQISAQDDFNKWIKSEKEKFEKFLSEDEKNFYEFLKKEWKSFELQPSIPSVKNPKPIKIPEVNKPLDKVLPDKKLEPKPELKNPDIEKITPQNPEHKPTVTEQPKLQLPESANTNNKNIEAKEVLDVPSPIPYKNEISIENGTSSEIDYYDGIVHIIYPALFKISSSGEINNQTIAEVFKNLSTASTNEFISKLKNYKNQKKLNDWGYFELVNRIAKNINEEKQNESFLLSWFLLLKSGYKVKIGLINKEVFLFVKCKESIYDVPYITDKNGEKTYLINFGERKSVNGQLFTYDGDYSNSKLYLSLQINEVPNLDQNFVNKPFQLQFNHKFYSINISLNKNIINYYKDYPATEYEIYFNAKVSNEIQNSLLNELQKIIQKMKEDEAINFLLRFVQTCFEYKTDEENFGKEKALFVEETLFYPASDCEDRAILFSYLVKNLLALKVIGIDYPNHIATAVYTKNVYSGDKVSFKGEEYIICDPTYINANAGMSMPNHGINTIENIIEIE
jgi:hypothetical protein